MIAKMLAVAISALLPLAAEAEYPWNEGQNGHAELQSTATSHEAGFVYGPALDPVIAEQVHAALTEPNGGAVRALADQLENYDNNPPVDGVRPVGLQRYLPGPALEGYTLFSSFSAGAFLVDMNGNMVKRWGLRAPPFIFPFPAKLLPEGHLIGGDARTFSSDGHLHLGRIVEVDWCGNRVWQWDGRVPFDPANPNDRTKGAKFHHDFQREGSTNGYPAPGQLPRLNGGRTWVLVHDYFPLEETKAVTDQWVLEEDGIVEVDENGQVVWDWHPWQHVDEMGFTPLQREAIRWNKVGAGPVGATFVEHDWHHLNATSLLGPNRHWDAGDWRFHPDNLLWDGRSSNLIAIVARHDDPAHGVKSGDIVWRTGPNYGPEYPEHRIGQIIGQHTAHMIPAGLPGAGNILVFDNGGIAGYGALIPGGPPFWPVTYRFSSRALEFDPVKMEVVWEYELAEAKRDGPYLDRKFFSWYISSVQRLANGNTLVMEGAQGRAFEVTKNGKIVWEYIAPYAGGANDTYRAYRYPPSYLPTSLTCP